MSSYYEYNVLVVTKPENDGFMLYGPTGDQTCIDGADLDEAKEVYEDFGSEDWTLEGTVVLLFGSWVCDYPDLEDAWSFREGVEELGDGYWTLWLDIEWPEGDPRWEVKDDS